jgi:hypothetical protein
MSDDDYRRDLVDADGFPLPPMLTTDAAQRRVKIREQVKTLLSDVYLPEGVQIWMTAPHKWFDGKSAEQMIADGRGDEVLVAAESLSGQIAT